MKKFYFTFGQGHSHHIGDKFFHHNLVAIIYAEHHQEARAIAFNNFGMKFCTSYDEESFDHTNMVYFPDGFLELN